MSVVHQNFAFKIEDRTATTIEANSGQFKRISPLLLHVITLIIMFTSALISKFANTGELFLLTFGITCGLGISFLIWVDVRAETDEEVVA